ncbi:MAG: GumC family protein, partial [Proteobacteria bacterium]|nr:GumC family protein [Pseudomonadota bacterium]
MAQYDVDLRDYWRIIKKRKAIIVLMVLLAGVCSYGFAKLSEPVPLYATESAIKIEQTTTMADFFMGGFWAQTENLITHAYIITSFPVLEQVAKMLGWLDKDVSAQKIRNSKTEMAVIQRLKSMVTAEQEQGTNIINIKVVSQDPEQAALVANTVARAYRDYNIKEKNRKTFETKAFIEEQLQLTANNLKQAEEALRVFKENYALISMDEQTRNTVARLYSLETEYEKVKTQKEGAVSQLKIIEKQARLSPEKFQGTLFSLDKDSPIYGLRAKLSDLLLKRETLLIDFTEDHPQLIEVNDQIQAVILETTKELKSFLISLDVSEADILERLNHFKKENQSLPEKALQLVRLQRELTLQESLYSQLKTKYQETLIRESGKVEEVSIVKPALVPAAPFNAPSKMMIIFTGIVMGLVIGFVFAFGIEVFDTSMGTIEDVEKLLQVPVLGVIPFMGKMEAEEGGYKDLERGRKRDLITHYDPKSLSAEAFRTLRSNLQFMVSDKKGKSFL